MKRKLLLFFLTIISAVCISVGFSACNLLDEISDSVSNTEQSSSGDEGSEQDTSGDAGDENADPDATEGDGDNTDPDTTEGDGDNTDPDTTDGDEDTDPDTTEGDGDNTDSDATDDDDNTDPDATEGDDNTDPDATEGDDNTDPDTTDDDDNTDPDTTGGDENTDPDTSDEDAEQGSTGDGDTEQGSTGDDDTEQGTTGDDTSGSGDESGETTTDFEVREDNSYYGYSQLAAETNGAEMQSLYYQMYTACEAFITDTSDVTSENEYYVISEISYGEYSLTADEAVSVWEVFYLENPMYYWLSSSCVYSESASKIYLCIDEYYASYVDRQNYDAAISSMVTAVSSSVAQLSTELEKAMAIHDYIISKIDYAYQSDGTTPETAIWAHNITGVSSKGYGVCEAYAKTYLALCLMNGLDCIIVTGNALSSGEGHAWNIVKIDGVWYGVDCTWDDTGDNDNLSYSYFGMNASTINSTRTTNSQTYGIDYLYNLPDITDYGIQLVTLFKGTTNLGTYVNIDAAFDAMTDATADYIIELYFYNTSGTKVETSPATTIYIYSSYTPAVNSITINGIYTDLGGGSFYVSYLSMSSKLTLNCDLEISNIILTAAELDLGEYTLTTSGYYCRLNGTIYDSKTTETISVKATATSQTDIYAALNVSYCYGRASINGTAIIGTYYGSDMLVVYGTATIGKYISAIETNYYNVYLKGGATLTVNSLVYDSDGSNKVINVLVQFDSLDEYPSLYLGGVDAQTCLFISGSVSATEAATPTNLDCAIATLGNADDFANIKIYYGSENKTSSYSVNTDNEIVYNNV